MSKSPLRKDKTCLNCNYVVENKFCPNCGQENTDTRKTFHHLFVHFFEDLTHYENAFWKTIKNLILKPASLTKEYLSGKRLSYLAPVRLYIFISFVTFFIIAIFPNNDDNSDLVKFTETSSKTEQEIKEEKDSSFIDFGYTDFKQLEAHKKELNPIEYWLNKKTIPVYKHNTLSEIKEKFLKSLQYNFPKALFIYMPLFALVLWLFHGKKRWYYFDHGIFTLHYFSFLLLIFLIIFLFNKIMNCFVVNAFSTFITLSVKFVVTFWIIYYFFPAHHRFYGETRTISFFKTIAMFIINFFLIGILIIALIIYTFININ
jgi:hypothetical protein